MFAPSLPKILDILYHFVHAFLRFPTILGHSSSNVIMTWPRYMKDYTKVSGRLYAQKSCSLLTHISFIASLHCFSSAPLADWVVLGWRMFKATHGTNMLHKICRG